jgi:hypothetical protein
MTLGQGLGCLSSAHMGSMLWQLLLKKTVFFFWPTNDKMVSAIEHGTSSKTENMIGTIFQFVVSD